MATVIQVIEGPDQGATFELPTDSVRLGVGTGVDFRLADPQLRGTLLVEWKNGTYHVRNDLDCAIYLDQKVLSRGESRVWYDDTILQPTSQTQLVLQHREASDSTQTSERSSAAGRTDVSNSGGSKTVWIVAGLGVCIGVLLLVVPREPTDGQPVVSNMVSRSAAAINNLEATVGWAEKNGLGVQWKELSQLFEQARVADRQGNIRTAQSLYQDCAGILNAIARSSPYTATPASGEDPERQAAMDAIEDLGEILNFRLIELGK